VVVAEQVMMEAELAQVYQEDLEVVVTMMVPVDQE
jgi:hypothetical protein